MYTHYYTRTSLSLSCSFSLSDPSPLTFLVPSPPPISLSALSYLIDSDPPLAVHHPLTNTINHNISCRPYSAAGPRRPPSPRLISSIKSTRHPRRANELHPIPLPLHRAAPVNGHRTSTITYGCPYQPTSYNPMARHLLRHKARGAHVVPRASSNRPSPKRPLGAVSTTIPPSRISATTLRRNIPIGGVTQDRRTCMGHHGQAQFK